jgi:hypothetical protein
VTTLDRALFMLVGTACGLAVLFGIGLMFGWVEGDKGLIIGAILGPLATIAGLIIGVYGISNKKDDS